MRLDEVVSVFLKANQHTFLANTRRAYRADLMLFARSLPHLDTVELSAEHLRTFLAASADCAPATLARRRAALRSCFAWAYRNGFVAIDPASHLEKISLPCRDPRPLTTDQVEALLAVIPARHGRNRLLFTLLYETGIRVGEALTLQVQDVHLNDIDGGYIRVVGKGNRERIVPLIDAARSVRLLRGMTRKSRTLGPLFHGDVAKGGSYSLSLDYTTVFYHFERYLAAARHARPAAFVDDPEPITIHRLRHTYATERLRAGVSLAAVRKLLGHQNLQTTLRYADLDIEAVKHELVEARRRETQR
jgi:site-specific recombinase XerD